MTLTALRESGLAFEVRIGFERKLFLPRLIITDGARRTVTEQQNISEVVSTVAIHDGERMNRSPHAFGL